jgi:transcription elongation factor Elf1
MLATFKCPSCFNAKVRICGEENKENALGTDCDCRFEFNPELAEGWDELMLYAGTSSGERKEKNPSFRFSRSIFPKAHSTADLTSVKSTGFIA